MSEKVKKEKKFDIVQFLVNNALIILIIAVVVYVVIRVTKKNKKQDK